MLIIDGVRYDVKVIVDRVSEMRASEVSGVMLDGSYLNDVIGTYLKYDITLEFPLRNRDRYYALYEVLNAPVEGHTFELPYNAGLVTLTGRVESLSDQRERMPGGFEYWKGLKFSIISNHPMKQMSLNDVITRGRTMLPELTTPSEGDGYVWHNNAWAKSAQYRDADEIAY